ncbi:hypothetical protein ABIB86_000402 [Bradyrhizobium sp. JR1.7]|uniref:hypothetical protein n=1 Tax=unclassified Bradyrhizobium TaxID=2631580 RepID=UPI003390F5BD
MPTITLRNQQTLDNWRKRLAGEEIKTYEADPDIGYYRLRKKDIKTNEVWWTPVAYFIDGGKLVGVIGDRNMNEREIGDLWHSVSAYPIPEEIFFAFEDLVEVPNADWPAGLRGEPKRPPFASKAEPTATHTQVAGITGTAVPAANREVARSDNAPPAEEAIPLDQQHKTAIDNAIAAAPKAVPTTAEEAALAEGSKNRIAELRLAAARDGKALYEPMYRAYTAEQKKWSPLIAAAETAEKALGRLVLTFRENERKRVLKEQQEAAAKQAAIDEANARAADRAIAAGKPEPAPVVVETVAPAAPEPVKPTYGTRSVKAELKTHLDEITDYDAVYAYFKGTDPVKALLTTLAKAAITAGRTVPGTKTREGLI